MRLIDADALKQKSLLRCGCFFGVLETDIDRATTIDAVPVVRCKDCAYCEKQLAHLYCGTLNAVVTEDWYCAFGKEKTRLIGTALFGRRKHD